jgi:hypothetical protein
LLKRKRVGDALIDWFQLFGFPGEAVAVEFDTSEHIRHAIAKCLCGTADAIKDFFGAGV